MPLQAIVLINLCASFNHSLIFLSTGSPQWIWHEDPDQRGVVYKVNHSVTIVNLAGGGGLIFLSWAVHVYTFSASLRWKQHEAYVQVLEAKYADLCCKYICVNVIQCNMAGFLLPAILTMTIPTGCTLYLAAFESDISSDALFFSSSFHRLSQWCDRAEGVGGEAQAAAAGVCTQGKHLGHATCHQGAGNARVHSMYLFFHSFNCFKMRLCET